MPGETQLWSIGAADGLVARLQEIPGRDEDATVSFPGKRIASGRRTPEVVVAT